MRSAELLSIATRFTDAAFDEGSWIEALDALARTTGSQCGQLIGIGGPAAFPFNFMSNLDPRATEDLATINGGAPEVNWRVAASLQVGTMAVVSERDYARARSSLSTDIYDDFAAQYDIELGCQTALVQEQDLIVGLAVLRGRQDGPTTPEVRRAMGAIAPHVRQSVKTAMLLERQGAQIVAGALEAMSITAFVCDQLGDVRAMTASAEDLVSVGSAMQLRQSRLAGSSPGEDAAIETAILQVSSAGVPTTIVLGMPSAPTAVSFLPLPKRSWNFMFAPGVLAVVRSGRLDHGIATDLLRSLFGLTRSEAEIARAFLAGCSRERIARDRGVSLGTIQSQMKSIFQKVGVKREADLAIRLATLLAS